MIEKRPVLVSGVPLPADARGLIDDYEKEPEAWKLGVLRDILTDQAPDHPLLSSVADPEATHRTHMRWRTSTHDGYSLLHSIDRQKCYDWRSAIGPILFEPTELHEDASGKIDYYGPVVTDNCIDDHGRGYAEPGYSDPLGFILFDNWNDYGDFRFPAWIIDPDGVEFDPEEMLDVEHVLNALGCEMEWSDEWTTCSDCGKAVRTQPDCHHWTPFYLIPEHSGDLVCHDCWDPSVDQEEEEIES